jgi:hypothetical protein
MCCNHKRFSRTVSVWMKWTVQEACGFDDDEIDSTCSWFDEKLNQV